MYKRKNENIGRIVDKKGHWTNIRSDMIFAHAILINLRASKLVKLWNKAARVYILLAVRRTLIVTGCRRGLGKCLRCSFPRFCIRSWLWIAERVRVRKLSPKKVRFPSTVLLLLSSRTVITKINGCSSSEYTNVRVLCLLLYFIVKFYVCCLLWSCLDLIDVNDQWRIIMNKVKLVTRLVENPTRFLRNVDFRLTRFTVIITGNHITIIRCIRTIRQNF